MLETGSNTSNHSNSSRADAADAVAPRPSSDRSPRSTSEEGDGSDLDARPVWDAFRYSLPANTSRVRAAVWRELTCMLALNLQHGLWAVARAEGDGARLDDLSTRIRHAGGDCRVTPVGHQERADIELQSRLARACGRLWDEFFNAADRYRSDRTMVGDLHEMKSEALDALRHDFGSIVVRDLVMCDAARRARSCLDVFTDEADAHLGDLAAPGDHRGGRRVEIAAAWELQGGSTRYVARLVPTPSTVWERAFNEFETYALRPTVARPVLRHGLFCWNGRPASGLASVDEMRSRIDLFERAHA